MPATVPGNFELDLFRAGLIPDPFFGTNIIDLRKLEDRHLFYVTTFDAPPDGTDGLVLHFEGIDTVAKVYVNGEQAAACDNMFIPWDVPLRNLGPTGNEIMVHILPAMMVAQERPVPLRQAPSTTVTPPDPAQVARFLWLGYPLPGGVGRNRALSGWKQSRRRRHWIGCISIPSRSIRRRRIATGAAPCWICTMPSGRRTS